ncbi:hypothetical protein EMCRGX_G006557 [Ephydatia muelleri]
MWKSGSGYETSLQPSDCSRTVISVTAKNIALVCHLEIFFSNIYRYLGYTVEELVDSTMMRFTKNSSSTSQLLCFGCQNPVFRRSNLAADSHGESFRHLCLTEGSPTSGNSGRATGQATEEQKRPRALKARC